MRVSKRISIYKDREHPSEKDERFNKLTVKGVLISIVTSPNDLVN